MNVVYQLQGVEFEWDSNKAQSNLDKHGITFEEAAEEMKAFDIKDKQLLEYQDGFAKMYVGMSQATRDFVAALDRKDVSAAKSAKKQLQKLGSTERKLVSGMNSYCQEN